jgi:hypothetical protein
VQSTISRPRTFIRTNRFGICLGHQIASVVKLSASCVAALEEALRFRMGGILARSVQLGPEGDRSDARRNAPRFVSGFHVTLFSRTLVYYASTRH